MSSSGLRGRQDVGCFAGGRWAVSWTVGVLLGCAAPRTAPDRTAVDTVLDEFHAAAARADDAAYFGAFADGAVFVGTDATEHWTVAELHDYARPKFQAGHGWTYRPRDRRVAFSGRGDVAWFEERLDHDRYGEMRGSGVLVHDGARWRIAQYVLSFPIPNERATAVLESIRSER